MFALDAVSRTVLAAVAFVAFGAAFVTTPIVARGEAGFVAEPASPMVSLPSRTALAEVIPRRDPFAGGDAPRTGAASPQARIALTAKPSLPDIPAALRVLPPNAGAGDGAFPFATGPRAGAVVTAVITGPHPFALVDDGGTTRVLTVGDRIGDDAIVSIDASGVRLSGGTALPVARASEPSAASSPRATPRPRRPVP